jgi:magnesium-transporting ATPase (P-type)
MIVRNGKPSSQHPRHILVGDII